MRKHRNHESTELMCKDKTQEQSKYTLKKKKDHIAEIKKE